MNDTQKDLSSSSVKDTMESYRLKAEAWMKDVESKFPEWKAKAEAAGAEAMEKFQHFTDNFSEQKKTFDVHYADAKVQAGEKFDQLKAKAESTWEELKAMASKYTDSSSEKKM